MGTREILGFDVGDLVVERARSYYGPNVWEVVGYDLRLRKIMIQRVIQGAKFAQSTMSPRKLVLIRTVEERVADAVMGTE